MSAQTTAGQLHPDQLVVPVGPVQPKPPAQVPFWQTNEGKKDIVTLIGVATDVYNLYGHVLPPGLATAIGVGLRALLNIFGNPQSTTEGN